MGKMLCAFVAMLWVDTARAAVPKCRALDANDGALILEVANRSATKCTSMLGAAMKKKRCTRARRGKQVEYMTQHDHAGVKGKLTTVTCGVTALPRCNAIDLKTKAVIAEVSQKSAKRCASLLAREVKKERCTKVRRGKKIEYRARFEQRGAKDKRVSVVCK